MAFRSYRAASFNFRQFGGASGGRVLQRRCACGNKADSEGTCDECAEKEGTLQRKSHSGRTGEAPSIVHDVLRAPGQPLETESRDFMEERFGFDFSGVRVHTDEQAHRSAEATDAYAYTVGHDVVFASGRYSPNTSEGRELLAHELTHVVQQDSAPANSSGAIAMGSVDEHEAAADQHATAVVAGTEPAAAIGSSSVALQRAPDENEPSSSGSGDAPPAAAQPCVEEVVGEDIPSLLQAGVITVIEFGAEWCNPCHQLKAGLKKICEGFRVTPPPIPFRFYTIDVEASGNEEASKPYLARGSGLPHLFFYLGSTERAHYNEAPDYDVLEREFAEQIKYATTSGAARGAKKGLGWGALAGGLAGIGGAIAIGTSSNLEGNALMGGILGSILGGAAVGLGLGAAIGAIAGFATDDRDKGPKEQKRKKLQKQSRSGDKKDDEQERKADQTAKNVTAKQPDLPRTRGGRAGIGAGIGSGVGAAVGAGIGLIAASQMKDTPYGPGALIGGVIGGAVGAIVGSLIGYFMGYDKKVTDPAVADGLIRRRYGKYMPGGVGPLNNASVHLVSRPEICEKNACRKGTEVDPSCGLLGWADSGPPLKPGNLPKDQPAPIEKAEDEPTCKDNKPLEHATKDRPVIYFSTDEASGTLIHEGLHAYADRGIEMLHNHVNEGLTEYFTRQVERDINMPTYTSYDREEADVHKMVDLIGEDKFAQAYFGRGRVPELHQAVNNVLGPCALITWAFNLQMNSESRANQILENRNVNYCKSNELPSDLTPGDLTPAVEPASEQTKQPRE
ncbi:MAG TPA: DUF4157 domain-containing protein [Pyrinomonadaceae bacterium]|nr:DUF4157 domain-containing protein [Pyrinomonadaceae bacterium]